MCRLIKSLEIFSKLKIRVSKLKIRVSSGPCFDVNEQIVEMGLSRGCHASGRVRFLSHQRAKETHGVRLTCIRSVLV